MLSGAGDREDHRFRTGLDSRRGEGTGAGTPNTWPRAVKMQPVNEKTDIYNFGAPCTDWRRCVCAQQRRQWRFIAGRQDSRADADSGSECNREVPEELASLIHQCLAFQPAKRPNSQRNHGILDHLEEGGNNSDLVDDLDWWAGPGLNRPAFNSSDL